ncbi:MAG: histidine triad nucleotide-binding protein [Myxococcota bacterium]
MTLFQKIIDREIPADIVYETDAVLAFRDINPTAPVHVLVIPKLPIDRVANATAKHADVLGQCLLAAAEVARIEGIEDSGYRLVINNGANAGQTVFHLHVHVIGGTPLGWPPFASSPK